MADGYAHFTQSSNQFPNYTPQIRRRPTPSQTPSPSRSPAPQSPGGAYFYNSGQLHHHSAMMNRSYMQGGMPKFYGNSLHGQPVSELNHLQSMPGGSGSNGGHQQHAFGNLNSNSNFASPQHASATTANQSKPEAYLDQQRLLQISRSSSEPHHHARQAAFLNRSAPAAVAGSGGTVANSYQNSNGHPKEEPAAEETGRPVPVLDGRGPKRQDWQALDLGGQGLLALSKALFNYDFLDKLYLNANKLTKLSPAIGRLRQLSHLDVSSNELTEVPPELGMLTKLKQLLLFDNQLTTLPVELGTLYHLEVLGIEGNPHMQDEIKTVVMGEGTKSLIVKLRDAPPPDFAESAPARHSIILDDSARDDPKSAADRFQVLCYNILCDRYATPQLYGYTPTWALEWSYRREAIKGEFLNMHADIICLQEIDQDAFSDFFMPELAMANYKGTFLAKTRAKVMTDSERGTVDGCATFYNSDRFRLLDKASIEFNQSAIAREDFKQHSDVFNRVMPRDNIAIIVFLENKETGSRLIVANTHAHWDPTQPDVKLVQAAMLMDEITRLSNTWLKTPRVRDTDSSDSVPPVTYTENTQIPLVVCGDFNSTVNSSVYELFSRGSVNSGHDDLSGRNYGTLTRDGIQQPFSLKSCYHSIGELDFTNYTPTFQGVLDYIFYSTNSMNVVSVLGNIEPQYMTKVPGFPNAHFPSDHIPLLAEFQVKPRKDAPAKPPPPDFGGGGGGGGNSRARFS